MENKIKLNINGTETELEVSPDGTVQLPDSVRSILEAGAKVTDLAEQELQKTTDDTDGGDGTKDPSSNEDVTDKFRGLPMSELIGAPLIAAADAQQRLAGIAWDFYQKIAYEGTGNTKKTRLLEFDLERPIVEDGKTGGTLNQKVSAPFIGLVPIPSLLVDKVDVDFQMEVTDTNVSKSSTSGSAETSASAKWFGVTASVSGKVSSSRENTRTTNQTAKYQVHVTASQQRPTEGLSKLMDIMAACIEPVPNSSGK